MKRVIIFWLNPKTGVIYNRLYTSATFYEVGQENQFEHVVLAICVINDGKLQTFSRGIEVYQVKQKRKFKDKIIDKLVYQLNKLKDK